jgi:hypothetical protein
MSALAFPTAVEYWKQSVATLADKSIMAMTLAASPTASAMVIGGFFLALGKDVFELRSPSNQ